MELKYHDENTIMPIERAFWSILEWLRVYAPMWAAKHWSAKRWVMRDFRTSVPLQSLSEITTQQVNDWLQSRHGEARIAVTITREFCRWQCSDISEIWEEMPELKIATSLSRKTEPIRRVFYTRDKSSRCWDIAIRIQWLQLNCRWLWLANHWLGGT